MPLERPDNRFFCGLGGSGKSSLVRHQARSFPRVLIHDTPAEAATADWATHVAFDRRSLWQAMQRRRWRIAWRGYQGIRPGAVADPERLYLAEFEYANQLAWAVEDCLVVMEELDTFTGTGGRLPFWAHKLVHEGRHRTCATFAVTRAPYLIPRGLTRNTTRAVAFQCLEPRDLVYLRSWYGDRVGELSGLARFEALDWTEGRVDRRRAPFA